MSAKPIDDWVAIVLNFIVSVFYISAPEVDARAPVRRNCVVNAAGHFVDFATGASEITANEHP